MKKILLILLLTSYWSCVGIANSKQISIITLQQFSQMLKNTSCIEFSESLKSKYGIITGSIEYLRREKFKGTCLQWNASNSGFTLKSKAKKISNSVKVIPTNFLADYQFYLFKKYKNKYLYVGKISTSSRYSEPEIDIYNFPNDTVYSTQYMSGGTGERDTDWVFFRLLKNRSSQEIFSIGKNGYVSTFNSLNRKYESKIDKTLVNKNKLKIDYIITYSFVPINKPSINLVTVKKTLLLDYANHTFSLSQKSPNSFEEINGFLGHYEQFFCKNYKSKLKKLLISKEKSTTSWSKKMIAICKSYRNEKLLYTLQIAAFKSRGNIAKYIQKIKNFRLRNKIQIWRGGGEKNYWIVSIGLFKSLEKVNSYKLELKEKYKDMQFVVRVYH